MEGFSSMANIVKKPNGTYMVRIFKGTNDSGKKMYISKVFTPSQPNLSYAALKKEMDLFIDCLKSQALEIDLDLDVPKKEKNPD